MYVLNMLDYVCGGLRLKGKEPAYLSVEGTQIFPLIEFLVLEICW